MINRYYHRHKQHNSYHNQDDEDHLHYLFLHLYTKIEESVNGYSHGYKNTVAC